MRSIDMRMPHASRTIIGGIQIIDMMVLVIDVTKGGRACLGVGGPALQATHIVDHDSLLLQQSGHLT